MGEENGRLHRSIDRNLVRTHGAIASPKKKRVGSFLPTLSSLARSSLDDYSPLQKLRS